MEHDHVLKNLNFDHLTLFAGRGGESVGKILPHVAAFSQNPNVPGWVVWGCGQMFATMLLH